MIEEPQREVVEGLARQGLLIRVPALDDAENFGVERLRFRLIVHVTLNYLTISI